MKIVLSSRKHHHMVRVNVFLITVALIAGMVGCEPACTPPQHDLTISSTTGGSVTTPGEGTFPYDAGTVVNLVAVADECYEFVNWTGDTVADPNSATTTITMDATKNVTANFALLSYNLTVNSTAGGSVTDPGEGTFTFGCGTVIDLVATPDTDYRFVEWTGDVDDIAGVNATTTIITIDGNYSITANFIAQYDLTIESTEGGKVITPGEGTFTYDTGTVVDLAAEAEESYHFVNWTGDINTITDPAAAQTIITMEGCYAITANFILFAGGNGTAEDPYQIADWRHFDNVRNYLNDNFILINTLDSATTGYTELTSETANNGKGWQPIGVSTERFTGTFDGQGYEIEDLFIDRSDESRVGLFGVISGKGVIENVGVNGSVIGKERVGILAGQNEGTVSNSYSAGSVSGSSCVGGLVGQNEGTVSNSYSAGSVSGSTYIGGLVGKNEHAVSNSFWDTETSGQVTSDGGTGKTTTEMQDIATFSVWDIIAVSSGETNPAYTWNIVNEVTYPFLSWQ